MKLILHFGIHRTGTTSIQNSLVANQDALVEQGFLYAKLNGKPSHEVIPGLLKARRFAPQDWIQDIEKQITKATHTVILSSEDFSALKSFRFLEQIPSKYETFVTVCLRRQDLWLESWYNQHVKWPWNRKFSGSSFDDFIRNSLFRVFFIFYDRSTSFIYHRYGGLQLSTF